MHIPDFPWEIRQREIGNSSNIFIISLGKLIFYLIFTPLVSHTSNSKAVGNGKWEIECVLPHKRRSEWLVGNGKREIAPQQEMPGTKWEMGNGKLDVDSWNKQSGKWEMGNGRVGNWTSWSCQHSGNGKREIGS